MTAFSIGFVILSGWLTGRAARWFDSHLETVLDQGVLAALRQASPCFPPAPPVFLFPECLAMLVLGAVATCAPTPGRMTGGMVVVAALVVCAWVDWRHRILPDVLVVPLMLGGLLSACIAAPFVDLDHSVGGLIVGAIAGGAVHRLGQDGLGAGDVKLLAALGAWLGPVAVLSIFLTACLFMLAVLSCRRLKGDARSAPMGPALGAGTVFHLIYLSDKIITYG